MDSFQGSPVVCPEILHVAGGLHPRPLGIRVWTHHRAQRAGPARASPRRVKPGAGLPPLRAFWVGVHGGEQVPFRGEDIVVALW